MTLTLIIQDNWVRRDGYGHKKIYIFMSLSLYAFAARQFLCWFCIQF